MDKHKHCFGQSILAELSFQNRNHANLVGKPMAGLRRGPILFSPTRRTSHSRIPIALSEGPNLQLLSSSSLLTRLMKGGKMEQEEERKTRRVMKWVSCITDLGCCFQKIDILASKPIFVQID